MKETFKRIVRGEKGHGLDLVLALLGVAGLVMAPLLGLMSTGLLAGQVYEQKTDELYAADAGVEDAMWKIRNQDQVPEVQYLYCGGGDNSWSYNITDVNGKSVNVTITYVSNVTHTYRVESIATGNGTGTAITAYTSASVLDFAGICDYAITSNGNITIEGGAIDGDVYLPDEDYLYDPKNAINGTVYDSGDVILTWPTFDDLHRYYWPDVEELEPGDPTEVITVTEVNTVDNPYIIGPYLADVENAEWLLIQKQAEEGVKPWVRLDGTVYVKGNFCLGSNINLDMNGCTIFATGTITLSPTCTIYGSGCIIARSDISFQPELSCEEGQYVLVLSIEGTTTLQPDSDFQGTVAGCVDVRIQPGNEIVWVSPYGRGLDFPIGEDEYPMIDEIAISSWEISAA